MGMDAASGNSNIDPSVRWMHNEKADLGDIKLVNEISWEGAGEKISGVQSIVVKIPQFDENNNRLQDKEFKYDIRLNNISNTESGKSAAEGKLNEQLKKMVTLAVLHGVVKGEKSVTYADSTGYQKVKNENVKKIDVSFKEGGIDEIDLSALKKPSSEKTLKLAAVVNQYVPPYLMARSRNSSPLSEPSTVREVPNFSGDRSSVRSLESYDRQTIPQETGPSRKLEMTPKPLGLPVESRSTLENFGKAREPLNTVRRDLESNRAEVNKAGGSSSSRSDQDLEIDLKRLEEAVAKLNGAFNLPDESGGASAVQQFSTESEAPQPQSFEITGSIAQRAAGSLAGSVQNLDNIDSVRVAAQVDSDLSKMLDDSVRGVAEGLDRLSGAFDLFERAQGDGIQKQSFEDFIEDLNQGISDSSGRGGVQTHLIKKLAEQLDLLEQKRVSNQKIEAADLKVLNQTMTILKEILKGGELVERVKKQIDKRFGTNL